VAVTSAEHGAVAPRLAGIFGVKFPVRDLTASRAWYERVFGLDVIYEFPDDDGVVRGVAFTAPGLGDVGVALRERSDIAGLSGFDPVVFAVDDRAAVDAWAAHLDALGVPNEVVEATIGWMLLFHDPDGLEIHLYSRDRGDLDNLGRAGFGRPTG
jgi:catechol 2,3-dioxygenase-like lactoylglutathione lyase family enzyme